ncbi:GNAT family N-acetyltransferase [Tropicimonas sp. IMCC6043]|uniref:GNAT family N-acetyltransferase n=1 Tax=Tropicimonas sp. IMCC6043 TaxID=2510645 RepID=UPI001F5CF49F|nr:GNAT family N-acetyltransferase [Tropicimonas sp. IMCC6043]
MLRGLSVVEDYADRVVLRTPSEPDFWFGNMVIFREGRVDPIANIARFRADFPEARHVTLVWDAPGMAAAPELDRLRAEGFEIDHSDVLTLGQALGSASCPAGIVIRPVAREAEWEQVVALQVETGVEAGHVREDYLRYVRRRFANRRLQVAEGWGCWFGAFDGDLLVGDLGIFAADGVARFQDVETRASHRRRGICAALVTAGLDWAAAHDPAALPVIIADAESEAGRIYRRCGFVQCETLIGAYRPPDGAKRPADQKSIASPPFSQSP